MSEQLSNKIQEQINAKNITPIPRWRFVLLRISLGIVASLSVIIGSFAVGAIVYLIAEQNRHGLNAVPRDWAEFLLMIPFIWIIILILFTIIAEVSIKHIKQGYRYSLGMILSISILSSIFLGLCISYVGLGRKTHEFFRKLPIYESSTYDSRAAWNRPTLGRLAGVVVSIQNGNEFSIIDFRERMWRVRFSAPARNLFSVPEINSTVRMIGAFDPSSKIFTVKSIHEWEN